MNREFSIADLQLKLSKKRTFKMRRLFVLLVFRGSNENKSTFHVNVSRKSDLC